MDIKKELEEISSSQNFGASIYNELKKQEEELINQQNELLKKMHLINIISAAHEIESLIENNFFDKNGVKFLEIITGTDYHNNKEVYFDCLDKDKEFAEHPSDDEDNNYYPNLLSKIFKIEELNLELTNIKFKSDDNKTFELKVGVGEKILKLFLSKELKAIYDYNKMQVDVPNNNNNENGKRLKI
jgi:hypothetical protein